ncbi:lipoate--protein ligase family protein [Candidatus Woesearchaeota archaeon]|nr:lipoate--protein ligase family protein [Candidatus Woesearchaeota archaeon]
MKLRVIDSKYNNAYLNMGINEALMKRCAQGIIPPTLLLFGWKPPAISIGYFQSLKQEVDLDKCRELGVDYVRRITGGGAVFHDTELTYSIVIPEKDCPEDILESYGLICNAVIKGLKHLGINAEYAPINDIICNGKKISGNAQTRRNGVVLQHGTILLDVDVDKMFSLLKVPNEKIKDKLIANVKERVSGINKTYEETAAAIKKGFQEQFNAELVEDSLAQEEINLGKQIAQEKYSTDNWNHMR